MFSGDGTSFIGNDTLKLSIAVPVAATQAHACLYNGKTQEAYFALEDDHHFEYLLCSQVMEPPPLVMAHSSFPYRFHFQGG